MKGMKYLLLGYALAIPGFVLLWTAVREGMDVGLAWVGGAIILVGAAFLILYRKEKDKDHAMVPHEPSTASFGVVTSGGDHLAITFDATKWIHLMRALFVLAITSGITFGSVLFMFGTPPAFFMIIYIGLPLGIILISMLPIPKAVRCDRKAGTIQVVSCFALGGVERLKTLTRAEVVRLEVEQIFQKGASAARLWIHTVDGRRTFVYSSSVETEVQNLFELISRFMEMKS